ncbi:hypothetical protein ANACOL_00257 [Anaerotruncus colihominis DSM 17241]|uniref:Uncharacterized protein n=1 Tax=Anaerotruncus colihominis DSM 17241 TaxID=445972 RepID=B0P685_9FIRM|nr:hypothetical protein ANACOL_00257 [Anaerotruncus colihominis DSM 17241]
MRDFLTQKDGKRPAQAVRQEMLNGFCGQNKEILICVYVN